MHIDVAGTEVSSSFTQGGSATWEEEEREVEAAIAILLLLLLLLLLPLLLLPGGRGRICGARDVL